MSRSLRCSAALALGVALSPLSSNAALLGDTVSLDAYHAFTTPIAGTCLTLSATRAIGAGQELTLADTTAASCSGAFAVDIDPASGILTVIGQPGSPGAAGNYEYGTIVISGFDDLVTAVTFIGDSGLFRADDPYGFGSIVPLPVISFTGSSLQIDYAAGSPQFVISEGGFARFQILQGQVPEPATLALLGFGLAGLGFSRAGRPAA